MKERYTLKASLNGAPGIYDGSSGSFLNLNEVTIISVIKSLLNERENAQLRAEEAEVEEIVDLEKSS